MTTKETQDFMLSAQKNEITEYHIYKKLSKSVKDSKGSHNQKILNLIANDELRHYNFWKQYTKKDLRPNRLKIWFYFFVSRIFGLTFGIRLMELGEGNAQQNYSKISEVITEVQSVIEDEENHEKQLIEMIDEELLDYIGSVVLGLNDALVELTGVLAGLTFVFNDTRLIAIAGLITGIAASFSMAASEYLATKSEENTTKNPLKASFYTGCSYIFTVLFLVFPYLLLNNYSPLVCLAFSLFNAIVVVFFFTFYISVARDLPFRKRFLEVVSISMGIAALSFVFGIIVNQFFGISA
ncbi:MAG: VIT1/CCC1 transporter family protein [Candidatus Hodarchaeales archaeon]